MRRSLRIVLAALTVLVAVPVARAIPLHTATPIKVHVTPGTGGPRSGRGGFGFDWKPVAGDYSVDVVVTGEMWGTRWTYAMVCPR